MSLSIETIRQARHRISPYIVQTPLIRLPSLDESLGCEVFIKAECMQITGAFKLRGAVNKALTLTAEQLSCGIVAASSGNHGRAIAYVANLLGTKATIVMPRTAPKVKVDAIRNLGAKVIQCETSERFQIAEKLCEESGATLVPPFNDELVMAGQGTIGLEILEQCPELDMILVPVSGGGLISGVATAVKSIDPRIKVFGAEPAALPRYSRSIAGGRPTKVEQKASIADALVAQVPGELCFPYARANTDDFFAVEDEYLLKGWKRLLMDGKLLCEPSSAIGLGAVLQGLVPVTPRDKVCFLISGGSVALEQLDIMKEVSL